MSNHHSQPLTALEFLGLASYKKVARVDLSDVGYHGIVYVRDLSAAEKQRLITRPRGKGRLHKDQSVEIDFSQLPRDASAKFLSACMVTHKQGGEYLEQLFADTDEGHVILSENDLVSLDREWGEAHGHQSKVRDVLDQLPSTVVNYIVKAVNDLSGINQSDDEVIEEKKGN